MLKRFGDRLIPAPVTVEWSDDSGTGPIVRATFDVEENTLQCRAVLIQAREGQGEVKGNDLRAVPIADLREQVAQFYSLPADPQAGGVLRVGSTVVRYEEDLRDARRSLSATRRKDDPGTLRRVAAVYQSNPKSPTKAVQEAFNVAPRTAGLYVKRAREAGLIPPVERRGN